MIDIAEILEKFAQDNDMNFVQETPKGINISADSMIADKVLIWLNVMESGSIDTDTNGNEAVMERQVEIVLFKECNLEDEGATYYKLLGDLRAVALDLYKCVQSYDYGDGTTFTSWLWDNGVDNLDHNCVMLDIRFTIAEPIELCELTTNFH